MTAKAIIKNKSRIHVQLVCIKVTVLIFPGQHLLRLVSAHGGQLVTYIDSHPCTKLVCFLVLQRLSLILCSVRCQLLSHLPPANIAVAQEITLGAWVRAAHRADALQQVPIALMSRRV